MSNELKSLAGIAEELELSKQAVYKRVNGSPDVLELLQPHTITNGTRKYYTLQGQQIIKGLFIVNQGQLKSTEVNQSQPEESSENKKNVIDRSQLKSTVVNQGQPVEVNQSQLKSTTDTATTAAIEALTQQLQVKDEQLKAAQAHIEELTKALTISQEQQRSLTEALTAAQALHAGTIQQQLITEHEEQDEITKDITEEQEPQKQLSLLKRIFKKKNRRT